MLHCRSDSTIALIGRQTSFCVLFVFLLSLCIIRVSVHAQNESTWSLDNLTFILDTKIQQSSNASSNIIPESSTIEPMNVVDPTQTIPLQQTSPSLQRSTLFADVPNVKPVPGFGSFPLDDEDYPKSDDNETIYNIPERPEYPYGEESFPDEIDHHYDLHPLDDSTMPSREFIIGNRELMPRTVSPFGFTTQQASFGDPFEGCYCDHYSEQLNNHAIFETESSVLPKNISHTIDSRHKVYCYCVGQSILSIPTNFSGNVHKIALLNCGLNKLDSQDFQNYTNVTEIYLTRMFLLETIENDTFTNLPNLMSIYIKLCPFLSRFPRLSILTMPSLMYLKIINSGMQEIPIIDQRNSSRILSIIDFDNNKIRNITTRSIDVKTESLNIEYNQIEFVSNNAFSGSQIAKLSLKGNRRLIFLENLAFAGIKFLRELDLSSTSITKLPVHGLSDSLQILRIIDTATLLDIPFIFHLKHLEEAYLTYPHHCCAFHNPEKHNPTEYERLKKLYATEESCKDAEQRHRTMSHSLLQLQASNPDDANNPGNWLSKLFKNGFHYLSIVTGRTLSSTSGPKRRQADEHSGQWSDFYNQSPDYDESFVSGGPVNERNGSSKMDGKKHHANEFQPPGRFGRPTNAIRPREQFCGDFVSEHRTVLCTPMPDPFNPCEDVMGNWFLRVMIWIVLICAIGGNFLVFVVLSSSKYAFNSQRFLMLNLAAGDFTMGVYLSMIAVVDLNSRGQYFNYAIKWQYGIACQIAGFVTVFASCLSIFTLTIITLERWFAITYAIQLNRRLKLSLTVKIMIGGWVYSFIMASLPIVGVNSYSKTSICLPMEHRNTYDVAYLFALLSINALAFILICACYLKMYISIISQKTRTTVNDVTIAKRMALLVFTDFACWAPIAFFGVTALAGRPLIDVTQSKFLLVMFYPLNSCANPFLYAIFTKSYRRDFFILVSRYGMCVNQAMQYRSGPRLNHHFAARYEACRHQTHHRRQANSMPIQANSFDVLQNISIGSQKQATNWSLPVCPEAHSLTLPRSVSRCEFGSVREIAGSHSSVFSHTSCDGVILYRYNCRTNRHHYFSTFNRRPTFASASHRAKELFAEKQRSHQSCTEFQTTSFMDTHATCECAKNLSKSFDECELDKRHRKHKRCHHGSHRYNQKGCGDHSAKNRIRETHSDSQENIRTVTQQKKHNAMVVIDNNGGPQVLAVSTTCRRHANSNGCGNGGVAGGAGNGGLANMNGTTEDERPCSDNSPVHSDSARPVRGRECDSLHSGQVNHERIKTDTAQNCQLPPKRSSLIFGSLIERLTFFARKKTGTESNGAYKENEHHKSNRNHEQSDRQSMCSSTSSDHYFERHRYQKNGRAGETPSRKFARSKMAKNSKRRSPKGNDSTDIQMKDQCEMLRMALQETTTVEEAIAVVEELSTATSSSRSKQRQTIDGSDTSHH